jgi:hypothetical protein
LIDFFVTVAVTDRRGRQLYNVSAEVEVNTSIELKCEGDERDLQEVQSGMVEYTDFLSKVVRDESDATFCIEARFSSGRNGKLRLRRAYVGRAEGSRAGVSVTDTLPPATSASGEG